jgi:putative FmdB family regulatory protein
MPIYEFACSNCSFQEEVLCESHDERPDMIVCLVCGEMAMVPIPTTASFDLRGEGFHKNDYE